MIYSSYFLIAVGVCFILRGLFGRSEIDKAKYDLAVAKGTYNYLRKSRWNHLYNDIPFPENDEIRYQAYKKLIKKIEKYESLLS